MGALAIGAVAAPVVGGVIGNMASAGDRDAANAAYQDALDTIKAVGAPPDLSKAIILQKFQQAGVLTPELEEAVHIDASRMENVKAPEDLKKAQQLALSSLQERGRAGFTAEDRAGLNKILGAQRREAEAKRQQILQNMQQRGMGGSGAELIAQLQGAQAADEGASERSVDLSGQASRNALEAMLQSGNLAGNIRGQDVGEQQAIAQAQDRINAMRAENAANVQMRNIGSRNRAQEANLSEKQRILDRNTEQANDELRRQQEAKRQYWLDRLRLAGEQSGAMQQRGQQYDKSAQRTTDQWNKMGQGVGSGLGAASMYGRGGDEGLTGDEDRTFERRHVYSGGYRE